MRSSPRVRIASRTEANREGVSDDKILSMLQGMIKQRNESITLYEKGNRPELAAKEKAEIAVIERFLPQQMDEAAVAAAIAEAMASTGAKTVKDMYPGYTGARPLFQVYHGSADTTLRPQNYQETVKEWTGVFGFDASKPEKTQQGLEPQLGQRQRRLKTQ